MFGGKIPMVGKTHEGKGGAGNGVGINKGILEQPRLQKLEKYKAPTRNITRKCTQNK